MKKIIALALSLLMLLALAACGKASSSITSSSTSSATPSSEVETFSPVDIRVAYHPGLAGSIIPGIDSIDGNQFFEKYGLNVEWVKFTSGPPEVAAMVSGDIQFGYIGHGAHTLAAEGSINIIALNNLGNSERIFVRKDSGISKIEDLKGKTVATQLGTSGEVILDLALDSVGLSKDDLNVINMDMAGAVAAFISDQVDAIACWDVHANNVLEQVGEDKITLLAATSDFIDITAFPSSWTVTPAYAEKSKDVVVRFIRALYDCFDYRDKNFDAAIKASAEYNELTFEDFNKSRDNVINIGMDKYKEMLGNDGLLDIYQLQLDYLIKAEKVASGNVKDYVRIDLMQEAMDKSVW